MKTIKKTSTHLQELIRACVDDERTLIHERAFVDAARAETLTRLACEREHFVRDLQEFADEAPEDERGSWLAIARDARHDAWVLAAGPNSGDAMAVCRQSRARTEARYDEALRREWPGDIEAVLSSHRQRLHEETALLNQLGF